MTASVQRLQQYAVGASFQAGSITVVELTVTLASTLHVGHSKRSLFALRCQHCQCQQHFPMPRLLEARLQAALLESQLVFKEINQNQHRVYADGQQPACPHKTFTDSSLSHPGTLSHLGTIKCTCEEIDECKAFGPCSSNSLPQEERKPPSREKHYMARISKRDKTSKSKNIKGKAKGKHSRHTASLRLPGQLSGCLHLKFCKAESTMLCQNVKYSTPTASTL